MVKKFTVPCDFSGRKYPVTFYIGEAAIGHHPIGFQSKWLADERGGVVPQTLMDSLKKLKEIADNNKVSFEELCAYVIDEVKIANSQKSIEEEKQKRLLKSKLKKKKQVAKKQAVKKKKLLTDKNKELPTDKRTK